MKKLLLLAAFLATSASMFAQGQVTFANTASTVFRVWTNNAQGSASNLTSAPNGYRFGLYAAQGAGAPSNSLTLVGVAVNLSAASSLYGFFNGGSPFAMPAPFASGDTITFQIRAWTLSKGNSYEEAVVASVLDPLNTALGVSPLAQTILTASPAPPAALFGTNPGLLNRGWEIKPIPEPSSIALGLLGLGAIALFRRRK
jgi:hypothetical protein